MTGRDGCFALLAAGGTGGHLYPALALADALVGRGHARESIRFVGVRGRLEQEAVPEAGYRVDLLPGRGLERRWTLANLRALRDALVALVRAIGLVRRYRPAVVVGFGSYAGLPTVVAARLARVPTVVHDRDAVPGLGNRIGVALGARAATSLPTTGLRAAVLVGNPVRGEFVARRWSRPEPPVVTFTGGSQGARTLNRAALELYDRWRARADVALVHICGPRNLAACEREHARLQRADDALSYTLRGYDHQIADSLASSSVVVSRSGASTVAEITALGAPSILVPLPGSPGDHQGANARALVDAGAAVLVPDDACDGARLDAELSALLADPVGLAAMGAAASRLARRDAAERLADLVEETARDC